MSRDDAYILDLFLMAKDAREFTKDPGSDKIFYVAAISR